MSELQPVTLSYGGKDYTVTSEDGIWALIEAVESVITYMELLPAMIGNKLPATRIFRAFAEALRYAGAREVSMNDIRKAAEYSDLGAMAGQLIAILQMGQPAGGLTEGESQLPPEEVEAQKKKAEAGQ